ncbi:Neurotrophin Receptor-Interacting Factor [Manis pentadactyla]|nr:Neurotrophin Receptor-Interacting Factor [Manis pentadactyla]
MNVLLLAIYFEPAGCNLESAWLCLIPVEKPYPKMKLEQSNKETSYAGWLEEEKRDPQVFQEMVHSLTLSHFS